MEGPIDGFDWDSGNRDKCRKHGVPAAAIEALFHGEVLIIADAAHSSTEPRMRAIGHAPGGRAVFVVFTIRKHGGKRLIRPISARYMHAKEVKAYEEANPGLQKRR